MAKMCLECSQAPALFLQSFVITDVATSRHSRMAGRVMGQAGTHILDQYKLYSMWLLCTVQGPDTDAKHLQPVLGTSNPPHPPPPPPKCFA